MKTLKLIKVIAGSLIVVSMLALNPMGVSAEWKQSSNGGWWYTEGSSWAIGWRLLDGKWYYFNANGYMARNTTINGCYLNSNGEWTNSNANSISADKDFQFDARTGTITKYKGLDTYVVIPSDINGVKVTKIGSSAFVKDLGKNTVESVIIPEGITSIGYFAFGWSEKLKNVSIPGSVTEIGESAFKNCDNLKNVTISEGVKSIGENAFSNCDGLESISIPGSVTYIGDCAFSNCHSLKNLTISEGVKNIREAAFTGCDSLERIEVPGSVENIGESAFRSCYNLKNVTISEGVKSIGEGAFIECHNLKSVIIPGSITKIGDCAFYYCDDLIKFYVENEKIKELLYSDELNESSIIIKQKHN